MRVTVRHREDEHALDLEVGCSVRDVLTAMSVPASMVLVIHEERIVPASTVINADVALELIDVSSGG